MASILQRMGVTASGVGARAIPVMP
jgi:hypothetical protein